METIKKLYELKRSLKEAGVSIPEDLLQKIALLEREVIESRMADLQFAADLMFEDIESPYEVIAKYNPENGVEVTLKQNTIHNKPSSGSRAKAEKSLLDLRSSFVAYIKKLNVGRKTKLDYIHNIDHVRIVDELIRQTGKKSMFEVTDINTLNSVLSDVGNGYHYTTLKHYINFLKQMNSPGLNNALDFLEERRPRSASKKLEVAFSDGTVICEEKASETFRKAVIKIGPQLVRQLGMEICGTPLISDIKSDNPNYSQAQKPVGDNLYLMTYSNTGAKRRQLQEISELLGLNLRISIK